MDFIDSFQEIKNKMSSQNCITKNHGFDISLLSVANYTSSELAALSKGFQEVQDSEAYNGRYFVKDGLIWIHNLTALKAKLGIFDENELRRLKYDIDTYHCKSQKTKPRIKTKRMRIYDEKSGKGIGFGRENMVYMHDGMYMHKDDCWW